MDGHTAAAMFQRALMAAVPVEGCSMGGVAVPINPPAMQCCSASPLGRQTPPRCFYLPPFCLSLPTPRWDLVIFW